MNELIDKRLEGTKTDSVLMTVTRENVRNYCHVIEEENQIFHDLKIAETANFLDLPVPATYPTLFWQYIEIPWLKDQVAIIQTEQNFIYEQTLIANITYACHIILLKVRNRGNKQFLKQRLYIQQEETVIATSDTTIVLQKE